MKRGILILIILGIHSFVFGNHYMVRNFSRSTYKSGAQNWGITQHESNAMYFANNAGLLEFDGKNWKTYPIINGTNVHSVHFSKNNRIYASTFSEFGYFQKQKNGQFDYNSLVNKYKIKTVGSNEIYKIYEGNKKIYFQSNASVYQYDGDTIVRLPFNKSIDASGFVHNVFFIASSPTGIFMLNGNFFSLISGSEILANKKVCSILPYQDNKVLFVTAFNGTYIYDGVTIMPFNTGIDDFLINNQVFCATTNGKQLVFGTVQRGIAVLDLQNKSVTYNNTYSGLQNNTVLSVAFDNQQNLWLGLDKGIDYVMLNSPIMNMFGTNNLYGAGYTSYLKSNTMFFGTNQGLYTVNYPFPTNSMPLQLNLLKGMEGQVWYLNEIDNTLFCGTDRGAFIINANQAEPIKGLPGTWAFKKLNQYPNLILGCSYQGLFILRKTGKNWLFSHFIKGNFKESSPMFEEDADGSVWFSHWQKGLFRLTLNSTKDSILKVVLYNEEKGLPSNRNNTVFHVGNELIFSSESGFYSYDKKADKMIQHQKWNKLFKTPPSYMRLHEGENGDVWCISGRFVGVAKKKSAHEYLMDSLTYQILQPKIIIGFEQFNFIDSTNLVLNTEDGFCSINTMNEIKKHSNFKVFINNIFITNNKESMVVGQREGKKNEEEDRFSHRQNSIRFEYIAPEFRNEGLVKYSYILENYDDTWSDFSVDNIKEYTQLPQGKYTFKVRARDVLESNEAVCSYTFIILPAWYESKIAFVIYGILLIALIIGLIIFINNQSKKGAIDMEKRKEIEINEQKVKFEAETSEKKKEIKELKNQQLQYELRHKSQELASSTMNLIRKNEMLLDLIENISKVTTDIKSNQNPTSVLSRLTKMERIINQNIEKDDHWKRFEQNFDLVYENYLKRLGETFPVLNTSDKKLCAYLKMDLSSKDIASLLNMSVRSVETNRYRLRKKMDLGRDVNLSDFLQRF